MATDVNTLMAEAACLGCTNSEQVNRTLELALLRQILLQSDPGADTTPATLLEDAKCYACLTQKDREVIGLALLDRIATAVA